MLTNEQIDRFYKAVEGLDLKYPVARIAEVTEESKGNVSKILSKKLQPSEAFIKKFYEGFKIVVNSPSGMPTERHWDAIIEELKENNSFLRRLVESNLAGISKDTAAALAYQKAWVERVAEKEAAGDDVLKDELMTQMGKLVRKYLLGN